MRTEDLGEAFVDTRATLPPVDVGVRFELLGGGVVRKVALRGLPPEAAAFVGDGRGCEPGVLGRCALATGRFTGCCTTRPPLALVAEARAAEPPEVGV